MNAYHVEIDFIQNPPCSVPLGITEALQMFGAKKVSIQKRVVGFPPYRLSLYIPPTLFSEGELRRAIGSAVQANFGGEFLLHTLQMSLEQVA